MTKRRRLPEPADESDIIAYLRDVLDDLNYSTYVCVCCNAVYHIDSEQWHVSTCCQKHVCDECFADDYVCDCREEEEDGDDDDEDAVGPFTDRQQQHEQKTSPLFRCVGCGITDDGYDGEWHVSACCLADVCGRCWTGPGRFCECCVITDGEPATNNRELT